MLNLSFPRLKFSEVGWFQFLHCEHDRVFGDNDIIAKRGADSRAHSELSSKASEKKLSVKIVRYIFVIAHLFIDAFESKHLTIDLELINFAERSDSENGEMGENTFGELGEQNIAAHSQVSVMQTNLH